MSISPSSPDFPGHWAACRAGDDIPLGAVQAPDKFTSYVCMWPEKDFVLGRGGVDPGRRALNAWFPYGGSEWSASGSNFRFVMLVDDGKNPGLYSWVKVSKLRELEELKPLEANGLCPMVVDNILGKGSVQYLTAWTCESGREISHTKEAVLRSLVLCLRAHRLNTDHGWREIEIHEPIRIPDTSVKNECLETLTKTFKNDSDNPITVQVEIKYKGKEGQSWTPEETEECDILTVIKSENVIRKLAEGDFSLGRALYGTKSQSVAISDNSLVRSYHVPPQTETSVILRVYQQSYELNCSAMEYIYTKDGKLILKRLVAGHWRGVASGDVRAEITERRIDNVK